MVTRGHSFGFWQRSTAAAAPVSTVAPEERLIADEPGNEWLAPPSSSGRRSGERPGWSISGPWVQFAYAVIDIFCVSLSGVLAFYLRFYPEGLVSSAHASRFASLAHQPVNRYGGFLLLYVVLVLLFCQWQGLYRTPRTRSSQDESFAVIKAVSLATLLLTAFIYLSGVKILSREVVLITLILNTVTLIAWRYAKRRIVIRRVERGIGARNAVIIGAGRVGQALAQQIEQNKLLGYRFKGFLDGNHSNDPRTLGKIEDLGRIARAEFVDEVFITIPSERELVKRIAFNARQQHVSVKVVPDLYDGLAWNAPVQHLGSFPVMELHWEPIPTVWLFLKRTYDVAISALGLVLSLPLLLVMAVWIRLDSAGPVLYRSRRVGKKGRVFTCYKLRTMVANADELKESLRHRNERLGPFFKINDDPRITYPGKFLRKYSLDELPQLWNVLKGDMSLVGPRPHPLDDYKQYDVDHLRRLEVKPGLTGLWQVTARKDPSFETNMQLDLDYIENWNLWLDIKILARTLPVVFNGDGQ